MNVAGDRQDSAPVLLWCFASLQVRGEVVAKPGCRVVSPLLDYGKRETVGCE